MGGETMIDEQWFESDTYTRYDTRFASIIAGFKAIVGCHILYRHETQ